MGVGNFPNMNQIKIKVVDMHGFRLELTLEQAVLVNQVEERVKEHGRVWWASEASRGAGWYLHPNLATPPHKDDRDETTSLAANLRASLGLSSSVSDGTLLTRLIRNGIPPQLRPKVWKVISGQARKKEVAPEGYYQDLLWEVKAKETKATKQIQNDLHRTFPGHSKLDSVEGRQSLRRILTAYSWRDSRVGYCQGMNFVAAYLLMVMRDEEEAFWMLATLLEDVLYSDCFSEDLAGTHVEQRVLKDLLNKKLPKLSTHLDDINFDISLVTTEWFLCLFSRSFPTETTLRIWDVLFSEGAKVLFRVAIAVFKLMEPELLQAQQVGEAIRLMQSATHHLYDPDILLKVAFEKLGPMPMTVILKQRQKQQPAVLAELEERLQAKREAGAISRREEEGRRQEDRDKEKERVKEREEEELSTSDDDFGSEDMPILRSFSR